jgi:neutral trehalase
MAKIATRLRDTDKEEFYTRWYHSIRRDINDKLWCGEEGFYYDYDLTNGALHKVQSVASFLPLFAGVCDASQAAALVEQLLNPETFGTPLPIPSISRQDPTYGSDMWRGPVWINYNYMISDGLAENGYPELALAIRTKTVKSVNDWYMRTGTVYEFYDPEHQQFPGRLNRKGTSYEPYDFTVRYQSIRDYGWSNTLVFDLLQNNMVCVENPKNA